jgi:hypothetical protein
MQTGVEPLRRIWRDHLARELDDALAAGAITGIVLALDGAGWWLPWAEVGPEGPMRG